MNRKLLTALGLAVGIMTTGYTMTDAEAGRRGHGFNAGWADDYGRHTKRRYHRNGHGHFGFHSRKHYGSNCERYLAKAQWTGHRHWWRKYNRCVKAYY